MKNKRLKIISPAEKWINKMPEGSLAEAINGDYIKARVTSEQEFGLTFGGLYKDNEYRHRFTLIGKTHPLNGPIEYFFGNNAHGIEFSGSWELDQDALKNARIGDEFTIVFTTGDIPSGPADGQPK